MDTSTRIRRIAAQTPAPTLVLSLAIAGIVTIGVAAGHAQPTPPPSNTPTPAAASVPEGPQPAKHYFVKRGAGKTYPRDPVITEAKLTAAMTDGRYSFLDEIWNPGFVVEPHFHAEHGETFYIVKGQVEWTVNGETHVMGAGDLVHIPGDTVHAVKVVGKEPVHTLMIYEPGGYEDVMEDEARYTPERRNDKDIRELLRTTSDFNPTKMPQRGPAGGTNGAAAAAAPQPAKHHFALRNKGETFKVDNEVSEVKLSAANTNGRYSFLDEIWKPGMSVPPHYHARHSETFYIVAGEVEWTVGGETHRMGPGDLVYIPPDTVHSVKVVGDKDVQSLMLYEPGGYEHHWRRESKYTPEQRKQPHVERLLRELNDFNPVKR